jgi:hypothetical protein
VFVIIFSGVALVAPLPPEQKLAMIAFSPIGAVFYWGCLLVCILIAPYLGVFGKILSHVLVAYFYLFSRVVVQEPPVVGLGLTRA